MKMFFVLIVIFVTLFQSCSSGKPPILRSNSVENAESSAEFSKFAYWLDVKDRFAFKRRDGAPIFHPFFDYEPEYDRRSREVSALILSSYNSRSLFGLDLVSGQKYKEFAYCKQVDVWESANKYLRYPNYTEAIIPRLMDQSWNPQRVIIFGSNGYYYVNREREIMIERVRVVGGIVEQYCHNFPCPAKGPWVPRLILVAVDINDKKLNHITNLGELKKNVDWKYAKSFLENAKGRSLFGERGVPSYRVVGSIDAKKAIEFAVNKGHLFTGREMKAIRTSCHALYDYVWDSFDKLKTHLSKNSSKKTSSKKIKHPREFGILLFSSDGSEELSDKEKKDKNISEKMSKFVKRRVFQYESYMSKLEKKREKIAEAKKKKKKEKEEFLRNKEKSDWLVANKISLKNFMKNFVKKYGTTYHTCTQFVRAANINHSIDRNWFFSYFRAYFILDQEYDSVFKCRKNSGYWVSNSQLNNGTKRFDKFELMDKCSDKALEQAFPKAVEKMSIRMKEGSNHYKYLTYDTGIGGSHRKIYSWVNYSGKRIKCVNKDEQEPIGDVVFPLDIRWKPITY